MSAMVPRRVIVPAALVYTIVAVMPCVYMLSAGTLGAWRRVWLSPRQAGLLTNTIAVSCLASCVAIALGTILAILVGRTNLFGRRSVLFAAGAQLFIAPHLLAVAGQYLFGTSFSGLTAAVIVLGISYYPLAFLIVLAGLSSVDSSQEEAAMLVQDRVAVLRGITLRVVRPHVLASFIFVSLLCLVEYGVPDILRLNTYPVEIFAQFSAYYDDAGAAALSAPLILIAFLLLVGAQRLVGRRKFAGFRIGRIALGLSLDLRPWRVCAVCIVWTFFGASLILPISVFARQVALSNRSLFSMIASAPIGNSLAIATLSATCITLLAFPVAYAAERAKSSGRNWILLLGLLPLAIPATVVGIGLIALWNRELGVPIYGSWVMLVLGCTARFSPFAMVIIAATFKLVSREQEEAALLIAPGWLGRVFRIVTPQCRAGISAAWAISFVFCLGELGASLLVMPPGTETLTLRLFNLMHYGAQDMVAILALLVVACGLAVSGILAVVYGWKRSELWSG